MTSSALISNSATTMNLITHILGKFQPNSFGYSHTDNAGNFDMRVIVDPTLVNNSEMHKVRLANMLTTMKSTDIVAMTLSICSQCNEITTYFGSGTTLDNALLDLKSKTLTACCSS